MRKIEREVELKWRRATIKNDLIFTWLFFENKKLTLRLLQIILPELNIKKVGDTQRENNQKKNKIYRGVRFDVLAEDEQGRTYDIEMQVANNDDLGKRISYYQGKLSAKSLNEGEEFFEKSDTYVIFICDFDYFGLNLPMYHTTTRLEEDINKVVDTGEYNVILNSRATDFSTVSTEVKAFLKYVRDNKVADDFTKSLDKEVVKIKSSTEVRESFMTWEEKLAEVEYYAGKKERKHNIINSIKKLDKKGYNKEKIIDTLTAVTDFTEEEISKHYDEVLTKQK
ncbi:Rpn family recombination-promoting nuclease/putative transposase [Ligilactobacillus salivarius]|uniref:Rpn family recombination-promoting nuclease/putative transposase n=1 Tax=Ligilactobacillus salivarius TaxID=1624 RepID=UPI0009DA1D80|nr:Rpn family recombination-promoting nuclease/putative transposase [Ligilactobacillus salivarius]OQR11839.1 hypothetical protein B6U45_00315 [Ligilactobacillus salivarius]